MTAAQAAAKIRQNLADLRNNREREVRIIANDLATLIKLRIQRSGQNYLNQPFSPYTPGYAAQRQKRGRQVAYVDYTDTGRMWASVYPDVEGSGASVTAVIQAHGQDNRDKVEGAVKKRGNILRPSKDELDLAEQANAARVRKYLQI